MATIRAPPRAVLAEEQALALRAAEKAASPRQSVAELRAMYVPTANRTRKRTRATKRRNPPAEAAGTRRRSAPVLTAQSDYRVGESTGAALGIAPAPRAHLYLAPSTATGVSVVYGYAGMPWAKRCSAASSTSTSPASETDDGLLDAFGSHLVDDLDHLGCEHHRWRDDRVPVAEYQRMDAWVFEAELDRVLVRLRRLAAGDIDRVARGTEGRMNLRNGIEIGRHCHQRQAIVDAGIETAARRSRRRR